MLDDENARTERPRVNPANAIARIVDVQAIDSRPPDIPPPHKATGQPRDRPPRSSGVDDSELQPLCKPIGSCGGLPLIAQNNGPSPLVRITGTTLPDHAGPGEHSPRAGVRELAAGHHDATSPGA